MPSSHPAGYTREIVSQQTKGTYRKDAHVMPLRHNLVHVGVGDKEADEAVWNGCCELNEHPPIVSDDIVIITHLKFCADWRLVRAPRQHHWAHTVPAAQRSDM